MSKKQTANRAEHAAEVSAALHALAILGIQVVDRCPSADCPLCGPALPIAA